MNPETLHAVILAGGKASRMGGGKDARLLAGRSLLDHVLSRIAPQCGPIALNANEDPRRFAAFSLPVLPDTIPDRPGPLAGILAAMDWAAKQGSTTVLTVPTDTPFLPPDLVAQLIAKSGADGFCLAASNGPEEEPRPHPTCGIWPVAMRQELRETLNSGQRKVLSFAQAHAPGFATWEYRTVDPFFNINTSEDLARAESLLSHSHSDCHRTNP